MPEKVHLLIRHLSGSYFRAGDGTIKEYRQPLGPFKKIKFDRFTISDEEECQKRKGNGEYTGKK